MTEGSKMNTEMVGMLWAAFEDERTRFLALVHQEEQLRRDVAEAEERKRLLGKLVRLEGLDDGDD